MSTPSDKNLQPHASYQQPRDLSQQSAHIKFQALDVALKSIEDQLAQFDAFSVNATRKAIANLADQMPVVHQIASCAGAFLGQMDSAHSDYRDMMVVSTEIGARKGVSGKVRPRARVVE